jgi:hypothetical protein
MDFKEGRAAVTVKVEVPDIPWVLPVMVVVPTDLAVAVPVPPMEATAGLEELHLVEEVRSCELPSLNSPVALKGWVDPTAREAAAGVT